MNASDLNSKIERTISDLKGQPFGNLMIQIAHDAKYLIYNRIAKYGLDPQGSKMSPYSTKEMLVSRKYMSISAYNKIASSKKKRKELTWVTYNKSRLFVLPFGYKQFRELHGRQTQHVDYTFTGKLWANIGIIEGTSRPNDGLIYIGAKSPEKRDVIESLIKRRGVFLNVTKEDKMKLKETFIDGVVKIYKMNGL